MDSSIRRRLVFVLSMVLLGYGGLGARLYQLMIINENKSPLVRDRSYHGYRVLPAQRGRILDRHLSPLATDRAAWSLYVSDDLEDPEEFVRRVSRALGLGAESRRIVLEKVLSDFTEVKVRRLLRGITGEKYQALNRALESYSGGDGRRKGWFLDPEFPRFYPEGRLAANVVGYVGAEQKGLGGIELEYEERLEGTRERVVVEVDARRRILADSDYTREVGVRGADVILTIDSYVQLLVERELRSAIERTSAKQASAVVLDPDTGEILAMATIPGFDPNRFTEVNEFYRKCRPITDMFEPGSVIKPFVVAGALERGTTSPEKIYFCENGRWAVPGRKGRILKVLRDDVHRFGNLSVRDILVRSSNIGICKIALEMGQEALYEILTRFGFGSVSGVDLPGETPGILRPVDSWSALSIYAIPFGQEIATNCLVIATAYATLANRGLRVQPHVVKAYRNPANGEISPRDIPEPERIIDPTVAQRVIDMLIGVTEDPQGTGYKHCRIPGFRIAGKTGTAQKAGRAGRYERGKRICSWAGFFPADDPKAVIYVMVDEPREAKYGAEVAGPVFTNIARALISYWGLIPDPSYLAVAAPDGKRPTTHPAVRDKGRSDGRPDRSPVPGVMPDLIGMPIRQAYLTLLRAGFRANFEGEGWVVSQETASGRMPLTAHVGRVVLSTEGSGWGAAVASSRR